GGYGPIRDVLGSVRGDPVSGGGFRNNQCAIGRHALGARTAIIAAQCSLLDRSTAASARERQEMHMGAKPRFQLLLVKPSHYDDDGYVIRWWRAMIPSNSLAAVYGIAADCADRQVLGPDIGIDIEAIDETNTRIDVPALIARLRSNGNFGLLALVGVQSN